MTTLKLEPQQAEGGGGGDVTREYVDQRDAATLDSANGYTDLVASGKQNTLTAGINITIEDNVISADGITGVSWGDIDGNLADQTDLSSALGDKQDTLTAGANITIDGNNEISATDTTYTAGSGLDLTGTEFSVDSSVVALKTDLPTKTSELSNDGSDGTSTYVEADDLATVATSGSYNDLLNKPTIPTVNNGTLTVTQNGTSKGTFTANQSGNATIALTDTTYSNFTGTDGVSAGTAGLVPAPAATDANAFLKGDGTWGTPPGTTYTAGTNIQINGSTISATDTTYSNFGGATTLVAGSAGLVPAPTTADPDKFLKGDGTWGTPTDTTYTAGSGLSLNGTEFSVDTTTIQPKLTAGANVNIDANNEISATDTTYTAGTNISISAQNEISAIDTTYSDFVGTDGVTDGGTGLVPAPIVSDIDKYLKSDGTWSTVQTGATITMQSTDPGEGQPLAANNFIAVY